MRPFSFHGAALAAILIVSMLVIGAGSVSSQAKPANVGSLKIVLDGAEGKIATTTLYQEGKVIASKDRRVGNRVEFDNVPLGVIEVRCESPMLKTISRRALLQENDRNQELIVNMVMGEGTTSIGLAHRFTSWKAAFRSSKRQWPSCKASNGQCNLTARPGL